MQLCEGVVWVCVIVSVRGKGKIGIKGGKVCIPLDVALLFYFQTLCCTKTHTQAQACDKDPVAVVSVYEFAFLRMSTMQTLKSNPSL